MDNENENVVETEELSPEENAAFDEVFDESVADDDDFDLSEDEQQPEEQPEETEEPEANTEGEPEQTEEPAPEQQQEAENQRFKLKYLGEETEVDRDKVIELAQKGMDYDKVKEELSRIKADSATMQKYKEQDAFLRELAEDSNISVEDLIEGTRVRMLMNKDSRLSEDEARAKVREAKQSKQTTAEKKEEAKATEPSPEERRQEMFAKFLQAFPDVKAEEIPKAVWDDAGRTYDLVGAYQRHEIRMLREENKTLRQNETNRKRSTGSLKTAGSTTPKDPFDEAWDSE